MLFTQIHSNVTSTSARHYDLLQTIVIEVGRVVSVGPGSGGDLLHGGPKEKECGACPAKLPRK